VDPLSTPGPEAATREASKASPSSARQCSRPGPWKQRLRLLASKPAREARASPAPRPGALPLHQREAPASTWSDVRPHSLFSSCIRSCRVPVHLRNRGTPPFAGVQDGSRAQFVRTCSAKSRPAVAPARLNGGSERAPTRVLARQTTRGPIGYACLSVLGVAPASQRGVPRRDQGEGTRDVA
jgi:hypothetical protein